MLQPLHRRLDSLQSVLTAVLAWYKKHKVDRFEIDANLTHDLQGVDQFTSNLKADVSDDWCDYMQKQIKEGIFHEDSKSYK